MSPTVDVHPVHGCEYFDFIAQLLQYPELRVYDLLDSVGGTDVIGLSSRKWRCAGCK